MALFSTSFFLSPLLLGLPASIVITRDSLTTSLTIGILLASVGAWLRSFIDDNFTLAMVG